MGIYGDLDTGPVFRVLCIAKEDEGAGDKGQGGKKGVVGCCLIGLAKGLGREAMHRLLLVHQDARTVFANTRRVINIWPTVVQKNERFACSIGYLQWRHS